MQKAAFFISMLALILGVTSSHARDLTFEDRVAAQEAIERVYYSHRTGTTAPFEQAVPRAVLERKVSRYLERAATLETNGEFLTTDMLDREMERQLRRTGMPDRLRELHAALGNDTFLIRECLVRPIVVARLLDGAIDEDTKAVLEEMIVMTAHTATWTGSEMIVWGGVAQLGFRYDPATDDWARMYWLTAPSERTGHAAVWTGTEVIVWGGAEPNQPNVNTGGRYNPITDEWTPTSTEGAPGGRAGPRLVWTGKFMVVWGGFGKGKSGGRYDPVADKWRRVRTETAPISRSGHSMIWTGKEVIVWGGAHGLLHVHYQDTGGRYDPETNTWRPTSTVGAPIPRSSHTAVWTGKEMIIWGGFTNDTPGGRYDPETDTWKPMTNIGSPGGSGEAFGAWTGSDVIFWNSFPQQGGAKYDPESDRWTTISTVDQPTGHDGQTAVWSGSEMIVWGGAYTNTGARYDVLTDSWTPTGTHIRP